MYGPNGIIMEIQIRTTEMDKFAGSGIASHWQYKIGGKFSAQAFAHDWLKSIIDIKKQPLVPLIFRKYESQLTSR
ncbi:MAG: hypothetical protein CM15mP93_03050 [Thiotrichaceae bacterium]|nr:MAG: hypothetical protein CM15mP93_03050 [Thiotrichaceae bacterium]